MLLFGSASVLPSELNRESNQESQHKTFHPQITQISNLSPSGYIDRNFCYYLVSSNIVRQQLSAAAQQTKIRHTSPDKIKDCAIWIPNFEDQKRIGRILTDIDSKIAINRQINDNLLFSLCRGVAINADVSPNLEAILDRSLGVAIVRLAA